MTPESKERLVAGYWRRMWERAPRQIEFTKSGKSIIAIAIAVGLAALNTGNNLLFLGWGLVLAGIVLSGLLSESAIRPLLIRVLGPKLARVGDPGALIVRLHNKARRTPSFAIETALELTGPDATRQKVRAPFVFLLRAGDDSQSAARFVAQSRGYWQIQTASLATAYPFGFFKKKKRIVGAELGGGFWVAPARVAVDSDLQKLRSIIGEAQAGRVGRGDEFFGLRPFQQGDDPRHIHWRRSARSGRLSVIETEADEGTLVVLELAAPDSNAEDKREAALAFLGSLAERLLENGVGVGVLAPGLWLTPDFGAFQTERILLALARFSYEAQERPLADKRSIYTRILVGPEGVEKVLGAGGRA